MNSNTPEDWPEDLKQWADSGAGLPALHQIMVGTMMATLVQARHVGKLVESQQSIADATGRIADTLNQKSALQADDRALELLAWLARLQAVVCEHGELSPIKMHRTLGHLMEEGHALRLPQDLKEDLFWPSDLMALQTMRGPAESLLPLVFQDICEQLLALDPPPTDEAQQADALRHWQRARAADLVTLQLAVAQAIAAEQQAPVKQVRFSDDAEDWCQAPAVVIATKPRGKRQTRG